jgi:hypothetical protein
MRNTKKIKIIQRRVQLITGIPGYGIVCGEDRELKKRRLTASLRFFFLTGLFSAVFY